MATPSPLTNKLIKGYIKAQKESSDLSKSAISIEKKNKKISSFYEKAREVVSWRERNILRRNAIEKMLKKKISLVGDKKIKSFSPEKFISELIYCGAFENGKICKSKIEPLQEIIDKYILIFNYQVEKKKDSSFFLWLYSIMASEIEDLLSGNEAEKTLISYMYNSLKNSVVTEKKIDGQEKNALLYIAIQKSLFSLDYPLISYQLLRHRGYLSLPESTEKIKDVAKEIDIEKKKIDDLFSHPLLPKFIRFCRKNSAPYMLVGDIIKKNPNKAESVLKTPEEVEKEIIETYQKRVEKTKDYLLRIVFYATILVFLISFLFFFLIELFLSNILNLGESSAPLLILKIFVPTLITALLFLIIREPPQKNKKKVLLETMKIIYKEEEKQIIKKSRARGSFIYLIITFFYALSFLIFVTALIWLLGIISFPIFSSLIFAVILSFISFIGLRVRTRIREIYMIEEKEGSLNLLIDILAFPIVFTRKLIVGNREKDTIFSIFFNTLIHTPFSVFLELLNEWKHFLREKKEKIY